MVSLSRLLIAACSIVLFGLAGAGARRLLVRAWFHRTNGISAKARAHHPRLAATGPGPFAFTRCDESYGRYAGRASDADPYSYGYSNASGPSRNRPNANAGAPSHGPTRRRCFHPTEASTSPETPSGAT